MTDFRQHMESLANRGTRRGAGAVIAAAAASARNGGERDGDGDRDGGVTIGDIDVLDLTGARRNDDDVLPVAPMEPVRPGRRPYRTLVAAAGLAALVGVASFAVTAMDNGGADSPEAAVRQLAGAIAEEDLLAAVDVLSPPEVASLRRTVDEASRHAAELDLIDDASAPLRGVDLDVAGLEVTAEEVAAGIAKVTVTGGTVSGDVDGGELSDLVRRSLDEEPRPSEPYDLTRLGESDGIEPFVMAVRHDGGWYVSPAYTFLEWTRVTQDLPAPQLGAGVAAIERLGAESPEAVARAAADALAGADWARLLELVPPDELPLYDYRDALLYDVGDTESSVVIDRFSVDVQVDGDTALATVDAAGTFEEGTWSLDDRCFEVAYDESADAFVAGTSTCGAYTPLGGLLFFVALGGDAEPGSLRFTLVQREGRWFVSPVSTVLDMTRRMVDDVDRRVLLGWLGLGGSLDPDGSFALGDEVVGTSEGWPRPYAYTFEGRAGQSIIGTFAGPADRRFHVDAAVYGPGGESIDAWGLFNGYGDAFELPVDGTYRLVVQPYTIGEFRFTVYDASTAPAEVLDPCSAAEPPEHCGYDPYLGEPGETCTVSPDGAVECTAETTTSECGAGPGGEPCIVESSPGTSLPPGDGGETCELQDGLVVCTRSGGDAGSASATTIPSGAGG